jgi:hypothetical protein
MLELIKAGHIPFRLTHMETKALTGIDELYSPPEGKVVEVNVPKFKFVMIDGRGAPGSEEWIKSVRALSAIDGAVRAIFKAKGVEYPPVPFESLWWAEQMSDLVNGHKEKWLWTCMLRQPDAMTVDDIKAAVTEAGALIEPDMVRIEDLEEGLAVQKLHVGPMEFALEDILKLRDHIRERAGAADGHVLKLHQIYLSEMPAKDPEKLRIIFRQPFRINE